MLLCCSICFVLLVFVDVDFQFCYFLCYFNRFAFFSLFIIDNI